MKNKLNLITVILTILFSFTVTSVGWAECIVTISPENAEIRYGESLQFNAETEGEGCNDPTYIWEIVASDCTTPSSIDVNGWYTVFEAFACVETIRVTDNANDNVTDETTVTITHSCEPIVSITPYAVNLIPGEMITLTAETTCGGDNTMAGSYTWDVQGGTANTTTGNPIDYTLGSFPGTYTITVTDTAYGDIQGTAIVQTTCRCVSIYRDSYLKSHWVPLPALIRIQTLCSEPPLSQSTQITFECDAPGAFPSIVPLAKLVYPRNGTINQFAIIMPAILTGNYQDETETCTVRVEGCEQTADFELNMFNVGPIPLSE